jgi:hypothetical protein
MHIIMRDGKRRWLPLILAVLVVSCSEDPTEQNALLAPLPFVGVAVRETTITATAGSSFRKTLPMNSAINLVGKNGNYTAIAACAFYSNYFPTRDTVNVLSARLSLRAATFFGDSTAPFGFTVYRISRSWTAGLTSWDSVQTGFYDASTVRGSYTGGVGSDTQMITVQLDTAMVREWLRTVGTSNADTKYGFVLVPTPETGVVRGFRSFEADSAKDIPTLEIIAQNAAGTVRDTVSYSLGIDTFVGNNDAVIASPQLLYVQAGIVYRSILTFDVSFIPRGSTVHLAELQMERDPATSKLNRFSGAASIDAHMMLADSATGTFASSGPTVSLKTGTATTYTADLHTAVQSWVRGPNYGVLFRVTGEQEFTSFDLLTFHNVTATNVQQRPRIRIVYSIPQN